MIKAVLFDVDGVLINTFEANLRFYQDIMKALGKEPITREIFLKMFHLSFRDTLKTFLNIESKDELEKIIEFSRENISYPKELVQSIPNVFEVVLKLKDKYKLGIVSSRRNRQTKYKIPQLQELLPHFDTLVFCEDVENVKPHPEPLFLAAKNLGLDPKECVYIGDAETDMHAAEAAGMHMITFADCVKGNATVCTYAFNELPDLIEKL